MRQVLEELILAFLLVLLALLSLGLAGGYDGWR